MARLPVFGTGLLEDCLVAQEGYDALMGLTDSRYRLSMIVARRAAQLKMGVPALLEEGELEPTQNTVTVAMKELETHKPIRWGDGLPSMEDLRRTVVPPPRPEPVPEAVAPADLAD